MCVPTTLTSKVVARSEWPRAFQARCQRFAVDELHGHVGVGFRLPRVVDRNDVGVSQSREVAALVLEAPSALRFGGPGGEQELQGDASVELPMVSLEHDPLPATAQLAQDLVVADSLRLSALGRVHGQIVRGALMPC